MRNVRVKFQPGARSLLTRFCLMFAAIAMAMVAAGCSHSVVASAGEHTVKVFPDQATYDKVAKMKSQGGAMGMLGGIEHRPMALRMDPVM